MANSRLDPIERFAREHALRVTAAELLAFPRDVAAPLDEAERHLLIEVAGAGSEPGVRAVYVGPFADAAPPDSRDVLWWLAADAWAVERCGRDPTAWAALHDHPVDDPASRRLFQLHVEQSDALARVLGREAYDQLLSLHRAELGSDPGL